MSSKQRQEGDHEQEQEKKELEALGRIVHAMRNYYVDAEWEVNRWERNFSKLSSFHKNLLKNQPKKISAAKQAIELNQQFLNLVLSCFDPDTSQNVPKHFNQANKAGDDFADHPVSPMDADKVRYVLKNLVRDWSQEGAAERKQSYGKIIDEIVRLFGDWKNKDAEKGEGEKEPKNPNPLNSTPPRVLVPGAGLGRLALELAGAGFEAQGNEFSYYMLLTASFMLNHSAQADSQLVIFPWMHSNCNQFSDADQLRPVNIPDVNPTEVMARPGLLSMCAGDFVEVYKDPEMLQSFDCVATCFFIDTAHNIIQYLEIIYGVLKDGGYWVNLGPLLYHWADSHTYLSDDELSIELSLNELINVAKQIGFTLIKQEMLPAAYLANIRSMYQTVYRCSFWTMQKQSQQQTQEDTEQLNQQKTKQEASKQNPKK